MNIFSYHQASDAASAITLKQAGPTAKYLGGGTNLVDLMRETVETPETLVDVTRLSSAIEQRTDGSLLIGAGVTNTALAAHGAVRSQFPLLSRAHFGGRKRANSKCSNSRR
ncbi:CO/xanthine dehydrogenase FAD-binding subunit [Agrobacterium larrymoorei]|uniref:CO/xanthine dehydrogenase FAD-binding subunit n=1 Tax=Agrobacterium larrymoorei TaxID=160699 RepID=A0AAJ2ERA3_9HYPH|nr:CO/xanthine dehydrogenase FAD-binding subunit [Agrobacterium larrymoorei]